MQRPSNTALAAECLLAVTGLFHDEPLGPDDGELAEALPEEWTEEIRAFLNAKSFRPFKMPKTIDQAEVIDKLSRGLDVGDARALVAALARPELADAYLGALGKARAYLFQHWPNMTYDTLTGPRPLPAGRIAMGEASALYAVLDDPGWVLREMRSGTLTGAQAVALKDVYPELFHVLTGLIWAEAAKKWPPESKAPPPWRIERVVRVLVGLPPTVSLSDAAPKPAAAPPTVKVDFNAQLQSKAQELNAR